MSISILKHESDVWRTADLLIGAGIKQSDFPKYMMPFFALLMVESRLIREAKKLEENIGKDNLEDFVEMFQLEGLGYNDFVIKDNKTLKTICKNDKAFDVDFQSYLKAFDAETRSLLGVEKGREEEKYLDISGVSGQLKKKDILFDTVKAWSEIDLTPFSNSEITTLEEHIKRKWADISAETAGEQYTPDDIISLISEIIAVKIENEDKFLTIYDPTCGGGNLLFGIEDKLQDNYSGLTKTYGDEWSDSLYALAKIESRFRNDSDINYGNTLTRIFHIEKKFDVVVANPPYGVDWKGYQKDIKNDTTGRFVALPSISDGQFLFTQHILYHLADNGLSVVVHNGSTLFSGDAGSGESNIRKHFFDNDWVEAIVQMPTDEFFNTGIYTYLWIFNKNKPADRKDKVILINASDQYEQLKKSKGKKRKKMNPDNRAAIVQTFVDFEDNEFAKVFDKWHFYFNKQSILLTNLDENGNSFQKHLPWKTSRFEPYEDYQVKSIKVYPTKITQGNIAINEMTITEFDKEKYESLNDYFVEYIKPLVTQLDYKEADLRVVEKETTYWFDAEKNTIIEAMKGKQVAKGCGKILVKASYKKATKSKGERIEIHAELTADNQKDYEIIEYSPDSKQNTQNIEDFMAKYVTRPFEYIDNVVGVEINFNKVFYKPEQLRSVAEITADLESLEGQLVDLEKELAL